MNPYIAQWSKDYRNWRNNMKYFTFAPKTKLEKVAKQFTHKKQIPTPDVVPDIDRVIASLSGKLAVVRELNEQLGKIAKPTKQMSEFKSWLKEYEEQLFVEWNRANS